MKPMTLWTAVRNGELTLLLSLRSRARSFYRTCFASTLASSGWLRLLANGPVTLDRLAAEIARDGQNGSRRPGRSVDRDALEAWLNLGVSLGELELGPQGYRVRSRFLSKLLSPSRDAIVAFLEEVVSLHHDLITETPARLEKGRRFELAEQNGRLIARSSKVLEPLVLEAIESVIPSRGEVRLLEIGCGSGVYIRHAARNPQLRAVGLELQPDVAAMARENLRAWRLEDRVSIETGDVRRRPARAIFDVVTLHNNIYYFSVEERVDVLRHVRGFLKPGGRLLVTAVCQGGSISMEMLNLWATMTQGCGRVPALAELIAQMHEAGFDSVSSRSLIPNDRYYSFVGREFAPTSRSRDLVASW